MHVRLRIHGWSRPETGATGKDARVLTRHRWPDWRPGPLVDSGSGGSQAARNDMIAIHRAGKYAVVPTVNVKLGNLGPAWKQACTQAVADLNTLFKRKGVEVSLALSGGRGPTISIETDPAILGTAVHGNTSAETTESGKLLGATIRLPVKVIINTPRGVRDAGPGILEVIVAHEFVHALGQAEHNSHLMAQTMTKLAGDRAKGDKLQAGAVQLPPLQLAEDSIDLLKSLWN